MRRTLNYMYLRPGNLWKQYRIKRLKASNVNGNLKQEYLDTDEYVTGAVSQAENSAADRLKHLWDQSQHSLTHTMVLQEAYPLRKGDLLTAEERAYLVLATDDPGALGITGLVYLEERNDVK